MAAEAAAAAAADTGWFDGLFGSVDSKDIALGIQGVGSIAGAWGQYYSDRKRNELLADQIAYEKSKDALVLSKLDERQKIIDDAFGTKKKKKKEGADLIEPPATA